MRESTEFKDNSVLTDEQLAELERATEQCGSTLTTNIGNAERDEFHHCYSLVDSLASPVRNAVVEISKPPVLPDYDDLQEIGRGGMGIVYRGLHKKTRRIDAIKVIRPDRVSTVAGAHQRELQRQLQQEAQLAARVAHEHIVPVYQVGEVNGCPWFSMQLVEGQSLRDLMYEGPISPQRAATLIEQIARAVDRVHRHAVLHGDIKRLGRNAACLMRTNGGEPPRGMRASAAFLYVAENAHVPRSLLAEMPPQRRKLRKSFANRCIDIGISRNVRVRTIHGT
ncbi:Serine/threonine-protein kinase PknD [Stieleria bergensis]|uniref:Serine/threonine-protein kinase PknD n=2 Tax=Stieleria bergensis TaxID=2528025 RepID=A0A517SVD8_9BACT|nr:Serine/threonine-protein kinase PknD [Planctomycetes bacterium SV_7m_r]